MKTSTLALPGALEADRVQQWVAETRKGRAIFLDYDGTLTPIAPRPEAAILSDRMRLTLRRLAAAYPVTIVSGRDAEVVRALVGIEGLGFVGSHGLDVIGPRNTGLRKEVALAYRLELDLVEDELRHRVGVFDGVVVERKRFTISTHVRLVAPKERPHVEAEVDQIGRAHPTLRKERGKMLFELRPDVDWDKGVAVRWLVEGMGFDLEAALFVGDDLTDETVFRILAGRGVGVVVAEVDRPTDACLRLAAPSEVHTFLERLIGLSVATDQSTTP